MPSSAPLSKHKECKPEVILEHEIEVPSIILIARNLTMTMGKQISIKTNPQHTLLYSPPYQIIDMYLFVRSEGVKLGKLILSIFPTGNVPDLPDFSDIELAVIYEIPQQNQRLSYSHQK
jgi:hypothetical protein